MSTWELVHLGNLVIGYIGNSFKDNFLKKICNIGVAMAAPATPLTPFLRKLAKVDVIPAFFLLHTETMQWHD